MSRGGGGKKKRGEKKGDLSPSPCVFFRRGGGKNSIRLPITNVASSTRRDDELTKFDD